MSNFCCSNLSHVIYCRFSCGSLSYEWGSYKRKQKPIGFKSRLFNLNDLNFPTKTKISRRIHQIHKNPKQRKKCALAPKKFNSVIFVRINCWNLPKSGVFLFDDVVVATSQVLLDLHGLPGSQNGEIHSGVSWTIPKTLVGLGSLP